MLNLKKRGLSPIIHWANMEAELREALAAGKEVKVKIDVGYPAGGGVRPSEFRVTAVIDGKVTPYKFNQ